MGKNIPGTYGDNITPEQCKEALERALKAMSEVGPLITAVHMRRADFEAIMTKPVNPGLPPRNPYNIIGVDVHIDETLPATVAYRMFMSDGEVQDVLRDGSVHVNTALTVLHRHVVGRIPALFDLRNGI